MNLCECRCGGEVKPGNRFLHGHNGRVRTSWWSSERKFCNCGCGGLAKAGNKFLLGHHGIVQITCNSERKFCLCGCGKLTTKKYYYGHKILPILNVCACGCKKECRKKFLRGHNLSLPNRKLPWNKGLKEKNKPKISELCKCGCNHLATPGRQFISGHNARGISPWNTGLTKETDARLAQAAIAKMGRKATETTKLLQSVAHIKAYAEHGDEITNKIMKNHGWKRFPYLSLTGSIIKMRSNWERLYAQFLDNLNIIWRYEPKGFLLSNGHRYFPDFYLPSLHEYHEVKEWMSLEGKKKIDLFQKEYSEQRLILITELSLIDSCNFHISFRKDGVLQ